MEFRIPNTDYIKECGNCGESFISDVWNVCETCNVWPSEDGNNTGARLQRFQQYITVYDNIHVEMPKASTIINDLTIPEGY